MQRQPSTLNAIHSTIAILTIAIIAIAIHIFTYDFDSPSSTKVQYAVGKTMPPVQHVKSLEAAVVPSVSAIIP